MYTYFSRLKEKHKTIIWQLQEYAADFGHMISHEISVMKLRKTLAEAEHKRYIQYNVIYVSLKLKYKGRKTNIISVYTILWHITSRVHLLRQGKLNVHNNVSFIL